MSSFANSENKATSLQKDPSGRGHRGGNPGVSSTSHTDLVLTLNPFYTSSDLQLLLINLPGAQVTPRCCLPLWAVGAVAWETQLGGAVTQPSSRDGGFGNRARALLCDCTAALGWAADPTRPWVQPPLVVTWDFWHAGGSCWVTCGPLAAAQMDS